MNHAGTTVALRATCAAVRRQQPRSQPLLQLFNGFARRYRTFPFTLRSGPVLACSDTATRRISPSAPRRYSPSLQRSFSASTTLAARKRDRPSPASSIEKKSEPLRPSSDSKLRPAQTVAAHTEGVPPTEEPVQKEEEPEEELTWRDYAPEGGMPLPSGDLSAEQITAIFHGEITDAAQGNYILSVLHWRRMSGALIDVGLTFPPDRHVSRSQALHALTHLRTLDPTVDESANAQVWAHEESHRLQEQIQRRAISLGIYKPAPDDEPHPDDPVSLEAAPEEADQGTSTGRAKTGTSILERLRATRKAEHAREEAVRERQTALAEVAALHAFRGPLELAAGVQPSTLHLTPTASGGISIARPRDQAWLLPVERKPWVKYYEEQAQIIREQAVPVMSGLRRLGPSALVLGFVLVGALYLSDHYEPPPRAARIWGDTPPAVATLGVLTAGLVAGFVLARFPPLWRTYSKYFTLVPAYPYAVSLLGAGFRHDTVVHLASNLVSLWLFGLLLHEDVGRGSFLAIYFASGALGGFASLTFNVLRKNWLVYIFGSSGSVLGVAAAACTMRPNSKIQVFGYEIPIAAWVFLALFTGGEVVAAVRGIKTSIDHAGHLGGILGGLAAGTYIRQRASQGRSEDIQKAVEKDVLAEAQPTV